MPGQKPAWHRYLHFWGSNIEEDVRAELEFHLEMRVKEYVARGMSPIEARRLAAERFGDAARAKEECVVIDETHSRSLGRAHFLAGLGHDVVFAGRLLRRQRLPSVVATLCLALGIGATTTMFSIGNTLLLRPMPYPTADRVVMIQTERLNEKGTTTVSSYPDFVDWRMRAGSFEEMGAIGRTGFTMQLATPYRANGGVISAGFFRVLGVVPEAGRLFTDAEDRVGGPKVMLVSHAFAEQSLGGAAGAIGKEFIVAGQKTVIVGVIPDAGRFPSSGQVWIPLARDPSASRGNRNIEVMGALKRGVTVASARQEMKLIGARLAQEHPDNDAYVGAVILPLRDYYLRGVRDGLYALSGATLLVLLIACTNVAALQIARASARAREIAVRTAIGASRTRIVRQLLTEAVMLAVAGGAGGVLLALAGIKYVGAAFASSVPSWMTFHVDSAALAFTLAVSMAVGIAFGILPALRLARVDPSDVLRGGQSGMGVARGLLQRGFVVAEIALSVMLVIGAALAIQSAARLQAVPLGLDPTNVVTFRVSLQGSRYDEQREVGRVISELEHAMLAMPGIEGAGATTYVPINGCCSQFGTKIAGRDTDLRHLLMVTGNMITPGFFRALRIPLLSGRELTDADDRDAPKVVIINETFAKRYWPAGDALGHEIDTGNGMSRIVGIVGDIKQSRMTMPPEPQFYRPHLQDSWNAMTFTVRVRGEKPERIMPDVRRAFKAIDPTSPLYGVATLESAVASEVDPVRLFSILFSAFAAVALALATAGVYATMSFFVSQRTRELGLRVALGAAPSRVVALVLRQGTFMAVIGGALGVGVGVFGARMLAHSLYGVSASEPLVYVTGAAVLTLAAMLASYGPARRASSVDPMIALRTE